MLHSGSWLYCLVQLVFLGKVTLLSVFSLYMQHWVILNLFEQFSDYFGAVKTNCEHTTYIIAYCHLLHWHNDLFKVALQTFSRYNNAFWVILHMFLGTRVWWSTDYIMKYLILSLLKANFDCPLLVLDRSYRKRERLWKIIVFNRVFIIL